MKEAVKILTALLAALLVSLLLATACTNPTNGEPGAPGAPGTPGTNGTNGADGGDGKDAETPANGAPGGPGEAGYPVISPTAAIDVEELFSGDTAKVRILSAVGGSIYGIVPATKTLEIAGTVPIEASETLTIGGTLHILAGGNLTDSSSYGYTFASAGGGKIQIDGSIFYSVGLGSSLGTVTVGPNGAVLMDAGDGASDVNTALGFLESVTWPTSATLTAANLTTDMLNWSGSKLLKLSGAPTISAAVSVAGKGNLDVTGTLTLENKLTASDAGNVTVTGSIELNHADAELAGKIIVGGTINVATEPTNPIPTTVNLSAGTIELDDSLEILGTSVGKVISSTASTLTLPTTGALITELVLDAGLTIEGPTTGLNLPMVKAGSAPSTLVLPDITVSDVNIVTDTSSALTIEGTSGDVTLSAEVTGDGVLDLDDKVLVTTIIVGEDATVEAGSLATFGGLANLASNKVTGAGTVNVGSDPLAISVSTHTFTPKIVTSGDVTLAAVEAIFNNGLESDAVLNSGAAGAALTLNGDSTLGSVTSGASNQTLTLTANGDVGITGVVTATEALIIEGTGDVTVGGAVTATKAVTVNNNPGTVTFSAAANTIAMNSSLTVGPGAVVETGVLTFGPAIYSATIGPVTYGSSNDITVGAGGVLTLGTGGIQLIGVAAGDKFTATGGVSLNVDAANSITVAAGGSLAFTVDSGGATELALKAGSVVALGVGGSLSVAEDGKITGFTDSGGTGLIAAATGADTSFIGSGVFSGYDGGVTPSGSGNYSVASGGGAVDGFITAGGGGWVITGTTLTNGGVLTSTSEVYP
jgi:hypothetical protein